MTSAIITVLEKKLLRSRHIQPAASPIPMATSGLIAAM